MISIKKFLDVDNPEVLEQLVGASQSLLSAISDSALLVCPHLGGDLQSKLNGLQERLTSCTSPEVLVEAGHEVGKELRAWGGLTSDYYKRTASEMKELMLVVAQAAGSVGQRDQKYVGRFNDFTSRLEDIANLEDLSRLRQSLVASVLDLRTAVEQMSNEGQEAVDRLNAELCAYRGRLEEVEKAATIDGLTGLANRRKIDLSLGESVRRGRPFSIMLFDLDYFKQINDRYGHAAGDDLLKQFGAQLQLAIRATDLAGRLGGDEFILLVDCPLEQAVKLLPRIQQTIIRDYVLNDTKGSYTISLSAAVGLAAWTPGEPIAETLARADSAMYRGKSLRKSARWDGHKS